MNNYKSLDINSTPTTKNKKFINFEPSQSRLDKNDLYINGKVLNVTKKVNHNNTKKYSLFNIVSRVDDLNKWGKKKNNIFDTNITIYELLKFLSETKTKGYEIGNVVDNDGNSIYAADIEDLATDEGQIFISLNAIEKFVNIIIEQQKQGVGSSSNINNEH